MLGELFLGPGFADKVPTRIDAGAELAGAMRIEIEN